MIANPALEAFRYNPYDQSLTREHYETGRMLQLRGCVVGVDDMFMYVCVCDLGRRGVPRRMLDH